MLIQACANLEPLTSGKEERQEEEEEEEGGALGGDTAPLIGVARWLPGSGVGVKHKKMNRNSELAKGGQNQKATGWR